MKKKITANINDMLTLGGIENYSDLHLIHPDGSTDKPGVADISYVLLVRKGTQTSKQLDASFKPRRNTPSAAAVGRSTGPLLYPAGATPLPSNRSHAKNK